MQFYMEAHEQIIITTISQIHSFEKNIYSQKNNFLKRITKDVLYLNIYF